MTNNCRHCGMSHNSSSLWCSQKCHQAHQDQSRIEAATFKGMMPAPFCGNCEYQGTLEPCMFPDPQKGGEAPFMTTAAMPDMRDCGINCMQFRQATNSNSGKTP